jgi:uncharacterized membrane protein
MELAKVEKWPIHQILVIFPTGVWIFSLICQIVYVAGGHPEWETVAMYNMAAGIIGALIAAIFGFADLFTLPEPGVKTLSYWHIILNLAMKDFVFGVNTSFAHWHMILNFFTTILFALAVYFHVTSQAVISPLILSCVASVLLLVSGWLGFNMVFVYGVETPGGMEEGEKMMSPETGSPSGQEPISSF